MADIPQSILKEIVEVLHVQQEIAKEMRSVVLQLRAKIDMARKAVPAGCSCDACETLRDVWGATNG